MKVNLNDHVTFVITERGCKVLKEYYQQLSNETGIDFSEHLHLWASPGDTMKMQLWEFCCRFGPFMEIGHGDNLIAENDVSIFESS